MKQLFLLFMLVSITQSFSCCRQCPRQIENNKGQPYNFIIENDYKIIPRTNDSYYRSLLSKDSLYLFIEEIFKRDTIQIFVNQQLVKEEVVTSEPSTGFAQRITIGEYYNAKNIGVSLNHGTTVHFSICDSSKNMIGIEKDKNGVKIKFYDHVPSYD